MVFYAVVSDEIEQVIEFFVDRGDAERMLARVRVDEPEWEETMRVEPVELATGGLALYVAVREIHDERLHRG